MKKVLITLLSALLIVTFLLPMQAFALEEPVTVTTVNNYGSRFSDNPDDWFADKTVTNKINYEMPDLGNTGNVTPYDELVDFATKYPEVTKSSTTKSGVTYYTYTINDTIAAKYNYVFEGFKIEHGCLRFYNSYDSKTEVNGGCTHDIVVRDFFIDASNGCSNAIYCKRGTSAQGQGRLIILDGDIMGGSNATITGATITLKRCKIHHVWADHIKGFSGLYMEQNYLYDGGLNGGDPHPDLIQFSGDNGHGGGVNTEDVHVYGNRFDSQITYVNSTNACIIFQTEFGGGNRDCHFNNNWFNGGHISITIGTKQSNGQVQPYQENVEFKDNLFGHGEQYINTFVKITGDNVQNVIKNGTIISGSEGIVDVITGSILFKNDGKQILNLDELTGESKEVTAYISNYSLTAKKVGVQVLLVNSNGEIINSAFQDFDIDEFTVLSKIKSGAASKPWTEFRYEDEPLDIPCTVDISSFNNIDAGCSLHAVVFYENQPGAMEVVREDNLLYKSSTTPNTHSTLIPEGYKLYSSNPNNLNYQFVTLVEGLSRDKDETLRTHILEAYSLLDSVDENYYNVTESKVALQAAIESYNETIKKDNEFHSFALSSNEKMTTMVPYFVAMSSVLGLVVLVILSKEVF